MPRIKSLTGSDNLCICSMSSFMGEAELRDLLAVTGRTEGTEFPPKRYPLNSGIKYQDAKERAQRSAMLTITN